MGAPGRRAASGRRRRASGHTLLEVTVVLALVLLFLGLAVPGFRVLLERQAMTSTVNDFFAAVNLARSEALHRGVRVDLVPAMGDRDWTQGWMVLVDANRNQQADAGEEVIFAHGPVVAGMQIRGAFTDSTVQYLAYTGSGRTRTNASSQTAQIGSWAFSLGEQHRRLVISFSGRPRVCTPRDAASSC